MKALLLVAHGSRRKASNQEVIELTDKLAALAGTDFDLVRACFLELADPGIEITVTECADLGVRDITVIPYFLSAGLHVAEDVPKELSKAAQQHKGLNITVCSHIGAISAMPELLLNTALTGQ